LCWFYKQVMECVLLFDLAAIIGPTAVGKTTISIEVARELNGEIISCDSMQIYKSMDIGTAKATSEEQNLITHHLLSVVEPNQEFSVAQYQKICKNLIASINARDKLPILVGGTGLYYQAVVDDYQFFPMKSGQKVREKWNKIVDQRGLDYVYEHLKSIDKDYASKINCNDQKRIVRALEVFELTGNPFSIYQKRKKNTYNLAAVGLYLERQELYDRINQRVDDMLKNGLIDEVQTLRQQGYDLSLNSMQALGYKQVFYYLEGFITKEEMIEDIKKETRRYAKRQFTWFNKDKRIYWINIQDYPENDLLVRKISAYIEGQLNRV